MTRVPLPWQPKALPPMTAAEHRRRHLRGRTPRILQDTEVKAFIDEAVLRLTFDALHAACLERFGKERTPGKSTMHRYWLAYKGMLAPELAS